MHCDRKAINTRSEVEFSVMTAYSDHASAILGFVLLSWLMHMQADQSEQTGYSGAFNRQKFKRSVSDRGRMQCCITGQYEKTDVFFVC